MNTTLTVSDNFLRTDEGGVWLIGKTRVPIDSVIYAFNEGASAEEIALQFSTLDLIQVYSVISYYLQNREKVEKYLKRRKKERVKLKAEIETKFNPNGIRERLLARQND